MLELLIFTYMAIFCLYGSNRFVKEGYYFDATMAFLVALIYFYVSSIAWLKFLFT